MLEEKHTYSYADLWEKEGEVKVCDTRSGKDKWIQTSKPTN